MSSPRERRVPESYSEKRHLQKKTEGRTTSFAVAVRAARNPVGHYDNVVGRKRISASGRIGRRETLPAEALSC